MNECANCGQSSFRPYDSPKLSLALLVCNGCGLVALEPAADGNIYVSDMEDQFYSDEFLDTHDWFQRWLSRLSANRRVREITKYKKNGSILEVGPGVGEFILEAQRSGFDCNAIEMSEPLAKHVRQTIGVDVRKGTFDDIAQWEKTFDIVVMSHVLEHVQDPVAALRNVLDCVTQDSIIYIAVPNISGWSARLSGWKAYLPAHLFYFSPKTLTEIVNTAGFEVVNLTTYQDATTWGLAIGRTLAGRTSPSRDVGNSEAQPKKKRRFGDAMRGAWDLSTIILGYCITPFRWVQPRFSSGAEIVLIARPYAISQGLGNDRAQRSTAASVV